jgi:hypothetical protein
VIEVRSYRRVFALERRIYRIDRLRLNPGGIPVRGVVYFLVILAIALILGSLPLIAIVARSLPWYVRYLALPGMSAAALAVIRVEGRPFHLAAHALVRYRSGPRKLAGLRAGRPPSGLLPGERWRPGPMTMLPDGSDGKLRRLSYRGPGALLVAVAHERETRRGALRRLGQHPLLIVSQRPGIPAPARGEVIVLERAARLTVRRA